MTYQSKITVFIPAYTEESIAHFNQVKKQWRDLEK